MTQTVRVDLRTPSIRWGAWLAGTVVTFGVLEIPALRRRDAAGTLSCVMRTWLGLEPRHPAYRMRLAAFYLFLGWVAVHLTSGRFGVNITWPRQM